MKEKMNKRIRVKSNLCPKKRTIKNNKGLALSISEFMKNNLLKTFSTKKYSDFCSNVSTGLVEIEEVTKKSISDFFNGLKAQKDKDALDAMMKLQSSDHIHYLKNRFHRDDLSQKAQKSKAQNFSFEDFASGRSSDEDNLTPQLREENNISIKRHVIFIDNALKEQSCYECERWSKDDLTILPCCEKKMCIECVTKSIIQKNSSTAKCPYCLKIMDVKIIE